MGNAQSTDIAIAAGIGALCALLVIGVGAVVVGAICACAFTGITTVVIASATAATVGGTIAGAVVGAAIKWLSNQKTLELEGRVALMEARMNAMAGNVQYVVNPDLLQGLANQRDYVPLVEVL